MEKKRELLEMTDALASGWERATEVLKAMFPVGVALGKPTISRSAAMVEDAGYDNYLIVEMRMLGVSTGTTLLAIPLETARSLTASLVGTTDTGADNVVALVPSATLELGNVLLNAIAGEVGRFLGTHLRFSVPFLTRSRDAWNGLPQCGDISTIAGTIRINGAEPSDIRVAIGFDAPVEA